MEGIETIDKDKEELQQKYNRLKEKFDSLLGIVVAETLGISAVLIAFIYELFGV